MAGLRFNALIADAGFDVDKVRLLRHETRRYGLTPYALWRDDPDRFNDYQRVQKRARRAWFNSLYWASFVVTPDGRTLFVGMFSVSLAGPVPTDWLDPISGRDDDAFVDYEMYDAEPAFALSDYAGRLVIDWGAATRSWTQRAVLQDKAIIELREKFIEPVFPGYAAFVAQLSDLATLPIGWRTALAVMRGVYLLTCPRTREQYVGAATGEGGFLARWHAYVGDGHGGNVGLRIREPADYRISILQIAGSADDRDDILAMEALWKAKLQSREMGLNRN